MAPRKFITPRLPVDAWPEADRQAWRQARSPADLFDEVGAAGRWCIEAGMNELADGWTAL